MKTINRITYKSKDAFEIVKIQDFFNTRSKTLIEKDYRISFWSLLYVSKGHGHHFVDFKKIELHEGSLLIVQKNQVHRYHVSGDLEGYIVHIDEPFLYEMNGFDSHIFFERLYGKPVLKINTSLEATNRKLIDLLYLEYQNADFRLLASLFQSFLITVLQDYKDQVLADFNMNEYFKVFRDLVEIHYMNNRGLDFYGDLMHVSKKTINEATRAAVDMSAKQFIIERILLEIKRYLAQDDLLNYEIADLLGFHEAANMSKFFKHYEGISPKEFKKKLKGE